MLQLQYDEVWSKTNMHRLQVTDSLPKHIYGSINSQQTSFIIITDSKIQVTFLKVLNSSKHILNAKSRDVRYFVN